MKFGLKFIVKLIAKNNNIKMTTRYSERRLHTSPRAMTSQAELHVNTDSSSFKFRQDASHSDGF